MAREPRIVAHLGRPETPEETAARKAENSRNYRRSQSFRNLVFALAVTVAVVAVIFWGVPRGELSQPDEIDVAAIAGQAESAHDHDLVVPAIPSAWRTDNPMTDIWRANLARLDSGATARWSVVYAGDEGFLRMEQALDADDAWIDRALGGATPAGTLTAGGVEWDVYERSRAADNADVAYTHALATTAGDDRVLIYGSASAEMAEDLAELVGPQVRELSAASPEEKR